MTTAPVVRWGSGSSARAGVRMAAVPASATDDDERGARTDHRRTHQNEMRLSALATEIVKIPM